MSTLKVPSLQHLARIWRPTPEGVEKELLRLARNKPLFSYEILKNVPFDFLYFKVPKEQVARGIERKERRLSIRNNLLDIVALLHSHCSSITPEFVLPVGLQYYSLARNLRIPFSPTLMYRENGQTFFPWFIYWRDNPLTMEQYSLFVTLVEEMLRQDPALEGAKLQIVDISAPSKKDPRKLEVLDTDSLPRLSDSEKREKLAIFVEGFERAQTTLLSEVHEGEMNQTISSSNTAQLPLFQNSDL